MDVPVWPWNRHIHSCVDCGLLGHGIDGFLPISPADRRKAPIEIVGQCFIGAWRLIPEYQTAYEDLVEAGGARGDDSSQPAADAVYRRSRQCELFTRYRPGLTPEAHQQLSAVHQDRFWPLIAASVGGPVGGSLSIIAAVVAYLLAK